MLVEIREKTLEKLKKFEDQHNGGIDMSAEDWAAFRMLGVSIANSLSFDIEMTELLNEIKKG